MTQAERKRFPLTRFTNKGALRVFTQLIGHLDEDKADMECQVDPKFTTIQVVAGKLKQQRAFVRIELCATESGETDTTAMVLKMEFGSQQTLNELWQWVGRKLGWAWNLDSTGVYDEADDDDDDDDDDDE